eukprot:1618528-Pleurochrysis_carterae.AAC.5
MQRHAGERRNILHSICSPYACDSKGTRILFNRHMMVTTKKINMHIVIHHSKHHQYLKSIKLVTTPLVGAPISGGTAAGSGVSR